MENTLFYFFSTLPQILAGFLAVSGVYLLYSFQTINGNIQSIFIEVYNYINNRRDNFIQYNNAKQKDCKIDIDLNLIQLRFNGLKSIFNEWQEICDKFIALEGKGQYVNIQLDNLKKQLELKSNLKKSIKNPLIYSMLLSLFSLIMIAFTRCISPSYSLSIALIAISILCFAYILWLLFKSLKESLT